MDNLQQLISGMTSQFGSRVPSIVGAIAFLIIGLIIAKILQRLIKKVLLRSGIDNLTKGTSSSMSLAGSIAKIVYWILLIYIFMFVLNMVGITGALDPLKNMLSEITGYVPNIVGAGLIGFIGYMLANIGKEAVGLLGSGLDNLGDRFGVQSSINLSGVLKQIVFLFILIPIILVALDTLNISTISDPAKNMLQTIFDSIPNIIAAGVVLFVFLFGGRFITTIVRDLLSNMGVDNASKELGISSMIGDQYKPSDLISKLLYFFIAFFGVITAVEKLQFTGLSEVLNSILDLSGHILFGTIILIIGNKISQFVGDYFGKSGAPGLSSLARFATLGLFLAISLKYMGIADDIVNLAFGLTLGAVAVAFALSFGLGGREAAGKQMAMFFDRFNKK